MAALTSLANKGQGMSYEHLRAMENVLVKMVMQKASPATNKAVLEILNITEKEMKPAVVRRAAQGRQDLLDARTAFVTCENNTNDELIEPNLQRDRLVVLKQEMEACVWGQFDIMYPVNENTNANNPSIGRSASIANGTKLGNISYTDLSCDSVANPYFCCAWPNGYDGSYVAGVYGSSASVILVSTTTSTTTPACEDTLTKCNGAKTACQNWENTHYMDNSMDQINDNVFPTSKECDRRDFSSVGQYLLAMKEYWKNSRTQADIGWEPMYCFCDAQLAICNAAQASCPHDGSRIPSVTFYDARWYGRVNYSCGSNFSTIAPSTTASPGTTTTILTTTTSTTYAHFCQRFQAELDHTACNQTNQRVSACSTFPPCYTAANSSYNLTFERICSYPNGDKYGVQNEYYGLLRMECVLDALFRNPDTPTILAAVGICVNKTIEDYNLSAVAIDECDLPWPACDLPSDCEPVVNVSSYRDVSGTVAYQSYYYENLRCPAPCLSSCCASLPADVTNLCAA